MKNKSYIKFYKKINIIDKDKISKLISLKTNIPYDHVYSVVGLLFSEMQRDLINGKIVKITNFGKFELRKLLPKKIININTGQPQIVERSHKLKFDLDRNISSFLTKFLME